MPVSIDQIRRAAEIIDRNLADLTTSHDHYNVNHCGRQPLRKSPNALAFANILPSLDPSVTYGHRR